VGIFYYVPVGIDVSWYSGDAEVKGKTARLREERVVMGRPREFDTDAALEKAMRLFWAKGYEGTSVADLTGTLGISRPSLYAAFGDKQSLFRAALERYAAGPGGYVAAALAQSTAREVAEQFLRGAANLQASSRNPGGCLTVNGAIACGDEAESVRQALIAHRAAGVSLLRRRFEQAKAQQDLPTDCDSGALARFVAAVVYGMAVLAAGGASRAELEQVIRTAMKAWPAKARDCADD
jgi:AcrR family transcriptional regulator